MLSLAIPNEIYSLGSPLIALFALVPLYLAYESYGSYRQAFLLTALHTAAVHLMSSFWLAYFKDFAVFTLGASAAGTGFIGGCAGLFLYVPLAARDAGTPLRAERPAGAAGEVTLRILWFAAVYTLYEWVKSNGFLGYPWGTVSGAMFRWRVLIQIADITGAYGVTFLTALFAAVVGKGIVTAARPRADGRSGAARYFYLSAAVTECALLLCAFVYGAVQYARPRKPVKYLNAVLVQQNYDPWQSSDDNATILKSQALTEETLRAAAGQGEEADIVVWSEGCLKYTFPRALPHYRLFPEERPLVPFIRETGLPFILGGTYRAGTKDRRPMNAALFFDGGGNFRGFYGKNHLVPFAETIPGGDIPLIGNTLRKLVGISAGFVPGDQYVYLDVPGRWPEERRLPPVRVVSLKESAEEQDRAESEPPYVRVCAPICFDDSFPDVCRPLVRNGSELFLNITDDSWSRTQSAEYQHFVIAAYRAVELRTTLARSTNSGYSVIVNPAGKIVADMPLFVPAADLFRIPVYGRTETVYLRFGNWLPHLLLLCALLLCVREGRRARRPADAPA